MLVYIRYRLDAQVQTQKNFFDPCKKTLDNAIRHRTMGTINNGLGNGMEINSTTFRPGGHTDRDATMEELNEYAEDMMEEARTIDGAQRIAFDYDLHEGTLFPSLMIELARWDGKADTAESKMRRMRGYLFAAMFDIAVKRDEGVYAK